MKFLYVSKYPKSKDRKSGASLSQEEMIERSKLLRKHKLIICDEVFLQWQGYTPVFSSSKELTEQECKEMHLALYVPKT